MYQFCGVSSGVEGWCEDRRVVSLLYGKSWDEFGWLWMMADVRHGEDI